MIMENLMLMKIKNNVLRFIGFVLLLLQICPVIYLVWHRRAVGTDNYFRVT